MEITIKHEVINEMCFDDILCGDIFYYQGDIWIKIFTLTEEADDNTDSANAIKLSNGEPDYFSSYTKVILPKNTDFIFEY